MNNKIISQVIGKNIIFLVFTIMATVNFMMKVSTALYTREGLDTLIINSVGYTLFQLEIDITQGSYNHLYVISNYPLIPIFLGVMYNIYILAKLYKNKVNSVHTNE